MSFEIVKYFSSLLIEFEDYAQINAQIVKLRGKDHDRIQTFSRNVRCYECCVCSKHTGTVYISIIHEIGNIKRYSGNIL